MSRGCYEISVQPDAQDFETGGVQSQLWIKTGVSLYLES